MPAEIKMPFGKAMRTKTCAAQLFGSWSIEPKWFAQAVEAIRSGKLQPKSSDDDDKADEEKRKPLTVAELDDDYEADEERGYKITDNGIAIICIEGTMLKYRSSFGGCSTVETRRAVRAAKNDRMVRGIMLYIDSPGGSCAGTSDLAHDVIEAGKVKPVYSYFANMGASAAYWVGSQAMKVWGNDIAMVGSIGTYCVLCDDTKWADEIGVKYTVVSTGPFKGLGADGKVTEQLVGDVQREINDLNEQFLLAVAAGRGLEMTKVRALADGRVHVGDKAVQEGLVDVIGTFDAAMQALSEEQPQPAVTAMTQEQFNAAAAEHPEWAAKFVEQGKAAGKADAHKDEIARMSAIEAACPGREKLAIKQFKAGASADDVKTIVEELDIDAKLRKDADEKAAKDLAAKDAEIEKLKAEAGSQGAVALGGAGAAANREQSTTTTTTNPTDDPEATAKAEWSKMSAVQKSAWIDEATFVSVRKREIAGKVTIVKPAAQ